MVLPVVPVAVLVVVLAVLVVVLVVLVVVLAVVLVVQSTDHLPTYSEGDHGARWLTGLSLIQTDSCNG